LGRRDGEEKGRRKSSNSTRPPEQSLPEIMGLLLLLLLLLLLSQNPSCALPMLLLFWTTITPTHFLQHQAGLGFAFPINNTNSLSSKAPPLFQLRIPPIWLVGLSYSSRSSSGWLVGEGGAVVVVVVVGVQVAIGLLQMDLG